MKRGWTSLDSWAGAGDWACEGKANTTLNAMTTALARGDILFMTIPP